MSGPNNESVERDLQVLVRFVKNVLFYKLKFAYDPKVDLVEGSPIWKACKEHTYNQVGLHAREGSEKETYFKYLWNLANKKRVVVSSLSTNQGFIL